MLSQLRPMRSGAVDPSKYDAHQRMRSADGHGLTTRLQASSHVRLRCRRQRHMKIEQAWVPSLVGASHLRCGVVWRGAAPASGGARGGGSPARTGNTPAKGVTCVPSDRVAMPWADTGVRPYDRTSSCRGRPPCRPTAWHTGNKRDS